MNTYFIDMSINYCRNKLRANIFIITICLFVNTVNSNTTNMNSNINKNVKDTQDFQKNVPENEDDHGKGHQNENVVRKKLNMKNNPYDYESFVRFEKFSEKEDLTEYGNYKEYKTYYLDGLRSGPDRTAKFKLSTRIVQTKYGKLQGIVLDMDERRHLSPLEVFLGVPYATPPTGTNRFSPTRAPSPWEGIRVSDQSAPACPQKLPDLDDEKTLLEKIPKERLEYLKRLMPYLKKQSEDCLYLNIFAPLQMDEKKRSVPVLVYINGEEFSWGSSAPYDGAILSSYSDLVVVTLNYRLGLFGFLNANPVPNIKGRVANYGLVDQTAALHWVQQNIESFGGDPRSVTLMGHDAGAACIHFLIMSPAVTPGLFHRAILSSGSALSSWALVDDPVYFTLELAKHINCTKPEDLTKDHEDIVDCLREASIEELLSADISPPKFLTVFGPSVDGVFVKTDFVKEFLTTNPSGDFTSHNNMKQNFNTYKKRSENRRELFKNKYDLMFGVVPCEAVWKFSSSDIQNGIEPDRRDRLLRTYVKNAYRYHLNEIFYTIVNEYTDWETKNPISMRDAMVAALSDAQYVAPLVQSGNLLSGAHKDSTDKNTFFYVFDHQTKDGFHTQKMGAVHGEELPYIFGAPLVGGFGFFPRNYTNSEVALSESLMLLVSNFARTGNPNKNIQREMLPVSREKNKFHNNAWEQYDATHQSYMEIGMKPRMKNYYRAHQLSAWLRLIPELHRAGIEDVMPSHNVFKGKKENDLYEGIVRQDPFARSHTTQTSNDTLYMNTAVIKEHTSSTCSPNIPSSRDQKPPNSTQVPTGTLEFSYGAYSTALSITIAIGCSLLIFNILVLAGVYYQRDRSKTHFNQNRFHEKNFETVSGKNSHYHVDSLAKAEIEKYDKKKFMNSNSYFGEVELKGPIEDSILLSSSNLAVDMMRVDKLDNRKSSYKMSNVNCQHVNYVTMPMNLSRLNNSPAHQFIDQEFISNDSPTASATSQREKPLLNTRRAEYAIDEMRV